MHFCIRNNNEKNEKRLPIKGKRKTGVGRGGGDKNSDIHEQIIDITL